MSTARKIRTVTPLSRHGNLSDRIYMELRQRLQRAAMGPDERLLDMEVAAAYGTSRMPARGFIAPTLSLDDVREIFEVRRMLEPAAIASVAKQIDAAAVAELSAALQRARQAALHNDGEEMTLANRAFRDAWLGRVKNKRLAATIARFVDHVQTVRINTLGSAEIRQVVVNGMERLHEALVNRDNVLARQCMVEFMTAAEHAYFSFRKAEIDNATPLPIAPGQAIT
jgi:DNA-binding GntR family transcriptional regulator